VQNLASTPTPPTQDQDADADAADTDPDTDTDTKTRQRHSARKTGPKTDQAPNAPFPHGHPPLPNEGKKHLLTANGLFLTRRGVAALLRLCPLQRISGGLGIACRTTGEGEMGRGRDQESPSWSTGPFPVPRCPPKRHGENRTPRMEPGTKDHPAMPITLNSICARAAERARAASGCDLQRPCPRRPLRCSVEAAAVRPGWRARRGVDG
jgi:hypothetical protein